MTCRLQGRGAEHLLDPAKPAAGEELLDRVCRGVASIQEGQQLRAYVETLERRLQPEEGTPIYVFLWKRPRDPQPWPLAYQSRLLAESSEFRVSEVVEVRLVAK